MEFKPIQEVALQASGFNMAHITNYFITRLACDGKAAMDFRHLNSKAFPLYKDGHVQRIKANFDQNKYTYKSVCLPEMKKDTIYNIQMSTDINSGDILSASCGCPAGLGPLGSCKHIAGMCYALEEFFRLHDNLACTSKLQQWNHPRKRKLDSEMMEEIKFVKHEHGKVKREIKCHAYDPRPNDLQRTTAEEVSQFKSELSELKRSCAFLHILHSDDITHPSPVQVVCKLLPPIPRSLREKVLFTMRGMEHPLCLKQVAALGKGYLDKLTHDQDDIRALEVATRSQSTSKRWYEEHFTRLSASNFGEIIKSKKPVNMCAKKLQPFKSQFSSGAIQWGKENEVKAREQYSSQLTQGLAVYDSGFHLSQHHGFLGASPDGIIYDTESDSTIGIIEIKCPYSIRDITVAEASMKSSFYCCIDENNEIHLKKRHNYYFQVQGQLAILNREWCDFIVWTLKGISVERILFDGDFWFRHCLPSLKSFYYGVMLPEIVYPRHPNIPFDYRSTNLHTLMLSV